MNTEAYTPTATEMPPQNASIEWITPSGQVVRGKYAGGSVWFPDNSPMYIYYVPTYWRIVR